MDTQEISRKIELITEDTIAKYLKELPDRIYEMLDKSILVSVGLKKDYGGYSIDYTNGREPLIAKFTKEKAHEILQDQFDNITPQLKDVIAKILPQHIEVIVKDIRSRIKQDIRNIANDLLRAQMQEFCKGLVDEEIEKYKESMKIKPILATVKEPENPQAGSTDLEKILMQDMVEKLSRSDCQ